jgi:hypothetical protein
VRDPLATVTRNGTRLGGTKVFINFPNDILLQDGSGAVTRLYLVQHWNMQVGTPTTALKCIEGLACMTDADQATEAIVARVGDVMMTPKQVEFNDEDNARVSVKLR